jgi:hypothetical protein
MEARLHQQQHLHRHLYNLLPHHPQLTRPMSPQDISWLSCIGPAILIHGFFDWFQFLSAFVFHSADKNPDPAFAFALFFMTLAPFGFAYLVYKVMAAAAAAVVVVVVVVVKFMFTSHNHSLLFPLPNCNNIPLMPPPPPPSRSFGRNGSC